MLRTLNGRHRRPWTLRMFRAVLTAAVLVLGVTAAARATTTFSIRGGGQGHGIGMSQYGADGYALHGASYQAILAHYYQGTSLGSTSPARTVRVLLATGAASFTGATTATGAGSQGASLNAATTYSVTPAAGGKVALATQTGAPVGSFAAPLTVSGPAPLAVPRLGTYRGSLEFYPAGGGVQTVNAVGLDDYVRGVVAAEMPSSWATAALEAQTVAARTYAITATVGAADYDVYDDTRSQMYGGVKAETASTAAAVAATSGQIVTYAGQPAVTYFFSSSGGYTESIQNAWAGSAPEPWLRGVPDPYDGAAQDPYHHWGFQMSLAAAAAKLRGLVKGRLVGIQVKRHGVSPRIVTALVIGTRGATTVSGAELQGIFRLDSTYASFTTISTQDPQGRLSGTVFPVPASRSVTVQSDAGAGWHASGPVPVSATGAFSTAEPSGRYRIADGPVDGPVVTIP
ncbi:MAG TPA: SpoIID/LytB domain-containing protein [Solirubrobacteraceae bacterium]